MKSIKIALIAGLIGIMPIGSSFAVTSPADAVRLQNLGSYIAPVVDSFNSISSVSQGIINGLIAVPSWLFGLENTTGHKAAALLLVTGATYTGYRAWQKYWRPARSAQLTNALKLLEEYAQAQISNNDPGENDGQSRKTYNALKTTAAQKCLRAAAAYSYWPGLYQIAYWTKMGRSNAMQQVEDLIRDLQDPNRDVESFVEQANNLKKELLEIAATIEPTTITTWARNFKK